MTIRTALRDRRAQVPPQAVSTPANWALIVGTVITVGCMSAMLLGALDRSLVGITVIVGLIITIFIGVPIGISMVLVGSIGLYALTGLPGVESALSGAVFGGVASWQLSVIPLFILMGTVLGRSGLMATAFRAATAWVGRMPGGLAVSTNFAGAALAAGSGSTVGIAYALGRVSIPEMLRAGYRPSLAVATVAGAGILGQIIPPSIMLVIYAGVVETPVGPQLMAGVIPGILLALGFAIMIWLRAVITPEVAPRADASVTWAERLRALGALAPVVAIVLTVIGGLYLGVFTATEAAAFGALAATAFGVHHMVRAGLPVRGIARLLWDSVITTVLSSAAIFLLLVGVEILTRVVALSRVAQDLTAAVADMGLSKTAFLLLLVVVYFVLGMFLDTLAMILLTVPVLMPVLVALDVNLLWFGAFLVIMAEIALLSPPMGMLSFVMHRMAQDPEINLGTDISLSEVFRGSSWFIAVALVVVVLLIAAPDLVTWLPAE